MKISIARYLMILMAVGFVATAPHAAKAAPFCTQVTGISPDCSYSDVSECRTRANQLKGRCVINPVEVRIVPGNAQFCLVGSDRAAQCIYRDYQSCDAEAQRKQAVCVDTTQQGTQPDLFRTEPERRY